MAWNEYHPNGLTPARGTLLMTKLKNQLKAIDPNLEFHLKNVSVNGMKMGCSGFVVDPKSNKIVYIDTDHNHGMNMDNALYRTAEHLKDYTGGRNHSSSYAELPQAVVDLLRS